LDVLSGNFSLFRTSPLNFSFDAEAAGTSCRPQPGKTGMTLGAKKVLMRSLAAEAADFDHGVARRDGPPSL